MISRRAFQAGLAAALLPAGARAAGVTAIDTLAFIPMPEGGEGLEGALQSAQW